MIARYRYWNKIRNLGDAITAPILADLMGLTPMVVGRDEPHLLATGSIVFMATPRSFVWGSGILDPAATIEGVSAANVRAVRGRKTLEQLHRELGGLGEVALGDPAILVDRLLGAPVERRYRTAIIPHHASFAHPAFDRYRDLPDCAVIDMRTAMLAPLEAIARAELVISQSLHGLIFATALGLPSVWISHRADDRWTFKFSDWFSTVDNPQPRPLALDTPIAELIAAAEHRASTIDRNALLAAFPREALAPADRAILDFASIRGMGLAVLACDWRRLAGGASTPWPEQDRAGRDALARQIVLAIRRHCASWAETPYLLLAPEGISVSPTARDALARFLDAHSGVEAMLVTASPIPPPAPPPIHAEHMFDVYSGPLAADGGLLVRPHVPFSFERKIDTCVLRVAAAP